MHSLDVEIAEKVGVNAALIYQSIQFWCKRCEANNTNFHDGKHWVYNSNKAWLELFPYLGSKAIRNALDKLEAEGLICVGEYNKNPYDRTKWYGLPHGVSRVAQKGECTLGETVNSSLPVSSKHVNPESKTDVSDDPILADALEVSKYLLDKILAWKPNTKKPNLEIWAKDISKAIRIDNRTKDELLNAIDWIYTTDGEFWQANILSAAALRKQYDKLEAQALRS